MNASLFGTAKQKKPKRIDKGQARPFIKWAGGKRTLIPEIIRRIPAEDIKTYWEPFLGGGAVFFAVGDRIQMAELSDINEELAVTYQTVRDRPAELIHLLKGHATNHSKPHYLKVRQLADTETVVARAARFIYLNKTCYNGLYRVNRSGQFNVPMGSYKNPTICDAENLWAASKALTGASIRIVDFADIAPGDRDFVYADPPYHGTFSNYDAGGFNDEDHVRLRDAAIRWHEAGASVLLSNANTELIQNLYDRPPFKIRSVSAPRNINSKANGREAVEELLIMTYDCPWSEGEIDSKVGGESAAKYV